MDSEWWIKTTAMMETEIRDRKSDGPGDRKRGQKTEVGDQVAGGQGTECCFFVHENFT